MIEQLEELRTIYLPSEINDEVSYGIIDLLLRLDAENDNDITLYMTCFGGHSVCTMALIDCIKSLNSRVIGIVLGCAMSAAALLLQSCDHRIVGENSTIMLHMSTWEGVSGNDGIIFDDAVVLKNILRDNTCKILADRNTAGNNDSSFWDTMIWGSRKDIFLTAQQAIDLGLADTIL